MNPEIPTSVETAVIGGGSAGAAVAGRLAEAGREIVLLERGPDYGPLNAARWPSELFDARALATSHDAGYDSGSRFGSRVVDFQRAHVIGGCSSHNGCIAAVGHPSDYDAWNMPGWSGEELRPLFARALERMRVRTYTEDEVGPFHRAVLDAAAEAGYHGPLGLDDLDAGVGFGLEAVNIVDGVRFNAAFAYLDPVRERSNFRIVDRARVDRVEPTPSGEAILHLTRAGSTGTLRAAHVIICAGTYDTPALLLRSGIGDPTDLEAVGIPVVHPLIGVGRNLHDHPLVECTFERSERLHRELQAASAKTFVPDEQTLGKFASSSCDGPYDIHVLPVGASTQVNLLDACCAIPVSPVYPRARGELRLRSADPNTPPSIEHNYLEDPDGHDIAVMREAIEIAYDLASQPSFRTMLGDPTVRIRSDQDIRSNVMHYYHPVGTCKLGAATDESAVCDEGGCLWGLPQITIADCSLMPQVPRANTNIPAVVIGERIAAVITKSG